MTKMPCAVTDGPAENPNEDWSESAEYVAPPSRRLELRLNAAIHHIAKHNSFSRAELIRLLKDARDYINGKAPD